MRLARSWVCVWLSQRRRNCCTTSSDARALPALHSDDESSALASMKIVASCARQAFVGMVGRICAVTHLHGACVSRAQGGSPVSTFFGLAVCKDTRDAARESSGERSDRTCNTGRVVSQIICNQLFLRVGVLVSGSRGGPRGWDGDRLKSRDGCEYDEHWSTIWTGGRDFSFRPRLRVTHTSRSTGRRAAVGTRRQPRCSRPV